MVYIKKTGVERKIMHEKEGRKNTRKEVDKVYGMAGTKGAQRGDFKLCRESDKLLKDYKRFKNPKDREKIKDNMDQLRKESRTW